MVNLTPSVLSADSTDTGAVIQNTAPDTSVVSIDSTESFSESFAQVGRDSYAKTMLEGTAINFQEVADRTDMMTQEELKTSIEKHFAFDWEKALPWESDDKAIISPTPVEMSTQERTENPSINTITEETSFKSNTENPVVIDRKIKRIKTLSEMDIDFTEEKMEEENTPRTQKNIPSAIHIDRMCINITRKLTNDEVDNGSCLEEKSVQLSVHTPLSKILEFISEGTAPVHFDENSSLDLVYHPSIPWWGNDVQHPMWNMSIIAVPKDDKGRILLPMKSGIITLAIWEQVVSNKSVSFSDVINGNGNAIQKELDRYENEMFDRFRAHHARIVDFVHSNLYGAAIYASKDSSTHERPVELESEADKERQARWKQRDTDGILMLFNKPRGDNGPERFIRDMDQFSFWGLDIQLLADAIGRDVPATRRLINRRQKETGKKYYFINNISTPLKNESKRKLSRNEIKSVFGSPKNLITIQCFFEIFVYTMSVQGAS